MGLPFAQERFDALRAIDTVQMTLDTAQGWGKDVDLKAQVSDAHFDRWSEGGQNAFLWEVGTDAEIKWRKGRFALGERLKLAWGQSKVENKPFRKSRDELLSELRADVFWSRRWSTYLGQRLETQLTSGFDEADSARPRISGSFDPMVLSQGLGMAWKMMRATELRAGAAVQQTWSREFDYADDPETESRERWKVEPGTEVRFQGKWKLPASALFSSEARLFNAFEKRSRTDLRWDHKLTVKWFSALQFSIEFSQKYDWDLDHEVQSRRMIAAGLQWSPFESQKPIKP